MTDYDTMGVGWEMDALVAEKVMGWKRPATDRSVIWQHPNGYECSERSIPEFSRSIVDVWHVVEKMGRFTLECGGSSLKEWCASFWNGYEWITGIAPTVPLAICRAALKAVAK